MRPFDPFGSSRSDEHQGWAALDFGEAREIAQLRRLWESIEFPRFQCEAAAWRLRNGDFKFHPPHFDAIAVFECDLGGAALGALLGSPAFFPRPKFRSIDMRAVQTAEITQARRRRIDLKDEVVPRTLQDPSSPAKIGFTNTLSRVRARAGGEGADELQLHCPLR